MFASNASSDVTITAEPVACTSDISASYSGWSEIVTADPFQVNSSLDGIVLETIVNADPFAIISGLSADIQVNATISASPLSASSSLADGIVKVSLIDLFNTAAS